MAVCLSSLMLTHGRSALSHDEVRSRVVRALSQPLTGSSIITRRYDKKLLEIACIQLRLSSYLS